jgi:hypothetical protein
MTTGANFKIVDGRVQFWESLISGDELLIQDHEARMHAKQGSYNPNSEYGNPYAITLSAEIGEAERNMRLISETKECTLQDVRFNDAVVDEDSIRQDESAQYFTYVLYKADGGTLRGEFNSNDIT